MQSDGEALQVDLKELKSGYSRNSHFTKNSQALAAERKEFEQAKTTAIAEVGQQRDQYTQYLQQVQTLLDDQTATPDWEKIKKDRPESFIHEFEEWQTRKTAFERVQAEQERIAGEQSSQRTKDREAFLDREARLLQEVMPEFADPEKAKQHTAALRTYAVGMGFPDDILDNLADHRAVLLLDKARKWDALQAKKEEGIVVEKKKTTPTVKPSGKPKTTTRRVNSKKQRAVLDKARQTGRQKDAIAALLALEE